MLPIDKNFQLEGLCQGGFMGVSVSRNPFWVGQRLHIPEDWKGLYTHWVFQSANILWYWVFLTEHWLTVADFYINHSFIYTIECVCNISASKNNYQNCILLEQSSVEKTLVARLDNQEI